MLGPRRGTGTGDDWDSPVSSALALAGFLGVVFVGFTLLAMGPLMAIDTYFNLAPPPPGWTPVLHVLDRIGQRAICLPLMIGVVLLCCRRRESWRPAVVAVGSVFALNLLVGLLKIGLGRGQPVTADPHFFIGGMAYPSGHTSNIVLVYGLCVYLLWRYYGLSGRTVVVLWSTVALLSVVMVAVSMTLNWHWFADLVAGLMIGGMVLELTVAVDTWDGQRRVRNLRGT